jgi:hypothetical protein
MQILCPRIVDSCHLPDEHMQFFCILKRKGPDRNLLDMPYLHPLPP